MNIEQMRQKKTYLNHQRDYLLEQVSVLNKEIEELMDKISEHDAGEEYV